MCVIYLSGHEHRHLMRWYCFADTISFVIYLSGHEHLSASKAKNFFFKCFWTNVTFDNLPESQCNRILNRLLFNQLCNWDCRSLVWLVKTLLEGCTGFPSHCRTKVWLCTKKKFFVFPVVLNYFEFSLDFSLRSKIDQIGWIQLCAKKKCLLLIFVFPVVLYVLFWAFFT